MKIAISFLTLFVSMSSFAHVSECNQTTKLQCTVEYSIRTPGKFTVVPETHTEAYELENWDEPSLAYCEASTGFNKNKIYIRSSLSADNQITISMARNYVNGSVNDSSSTTVDASTGAVAKVSQSFSPEIDLSVDGNTASLSSAAVTCKIVK